MKDYTIKGIPDEDYRRLRILAAENEKSINKFLLALINDTVSKPKQKRRS